MTFKAPDSLAEQIAHHLAERIIRGELKPGERIQEQKVTAALNVSRGSVREALLILERRHLIVILPRRGAQVSVLTPHNITSLCALMSEMYILLGLAVARSWKEPLDLAAYPFANNPYLEETVENLQPSMSRFYFLALDQRQAEMSEYLTLFSQLLEAVVVRDLARIRDVLTRYAERSCQSVLSALEAS